MAVRGQFIPKNPQKYVGDSSKIFFRSLWEAKVMQWMDSRSSVILWGSEEQAIPYLSPVDNKIHNYFPDFFMEYVNTDGIKLKEIIEVKPLHESDEDYAKSDRSKDALVINNAKWAAAINWCAINGMTFRVLTERSIFRQVPKKSKKKLNG